MRDHSIRRSSKLSKSGDCGRNRGGKWEEDVACQQGHKEN